MRGQLVVQQIGGVLGRWKVTVFGVPESSHMAAALVEADYTLKQLTTGDENPQVRGFRSYLSMMRPNADSMRRWWFSPRYDAIETNDQQTAWHLSGPRLQVSAQDEIVDANGNRQDAPSTHARLEKYAQQFTEKIPALAEKVPSIAQLCRRCGYTCSAGSQGSEFLVVVGLVNSPKSHVESNIRHKDMTA